MAPRKGWKKADLPCEFRPEAMSSPGEEWRPVVGWERHYRVSNLGRVYSLHQSGRFVTGMRVRDGYHVVKVRHGERRANVQVHHMVLEAFVGPRPAGAQGCHCNGDSTDDRAINLRWDTPQANQNDRVKHGTSIRGRSTPRLPADTVRSIRTTPGITAAEWAAKLGVSATTIFNARRGRTWRQVA